ncbi:MAG: RNA methyltransferase [Bacteroidetes bacterium]|nr:RNA methyltransferase [Bacteroidota bacterium]
MESPNLQAYLEKMLTAERKEKFREILAYRTKHFTVALEDVYQMHNASAVIRSCDVFGIQEAHLIETKYAKRIDKNIAMGAQKWVDVQSYDSIQNCIDRLKSEGYRIAATTPHGNSMLLDDLDINPKTAFFFGTEKNGLSSQIMAQSDLRVKIPMFGFTESLNVSVSVAIVLNQLRKRLNESDIRWQLTEAEKAEKQLDWTKKSIKNVDAIIARFLSEHSTS